ncbi:ImmA/IrrE family metallo-endopeptidase, partial [uncultured Thomasclavelia sp.]|uniref:ImmA/IrrE family metallo-endopeptidase n=1 Tax=uncultured Thomasclavelia sp. TaxID=3025759 RepID=UPI00280C05A1
ENEKVTLSKISNDIFSFVNSKGNVINLDIVSAQKVFNNYRKEQRREKVNKAQEILTEGCKKFFTSEKFQQYLDVMTTFRHYSARNSMLILMQRPNATFVASAADWKNKHNRYINKGERALKILSPNIKNISEMRDKTDPITGKIVLDENGKPIKEKTGNTQKKIVGWLTVPVFDVSQTNGEPLPTLATVLNQDLKNYDIIIDAIKKIAPCPIFIDDLGERNEVLKGYYSILKNEIHIRENMPQLQTIKTAIHELAHSVLHNKDTEKNKATKEVEAESVAYIVSKTLGLDTSDYSFGYIASWSSDKTTPELLKSADTIKFTANNILTQIEKECPELFQVVEATESNVELNITEKNNNVEPSLNSNPEFSVGDIIKYDNDLWKIAKINGELSVEIENINNPEYVLPVVSSSASGSWRDIFVQEGVKLVNMSPIKKIEVAVESTNDYTDSNFHKSLVDIDVQNKDGTYGKTVDLYRLVKTNDDGKIEPYNDKVFTGAEDAIAAALKDENLKLINYDKMVDKCYKDGQQINGLKDLILEAQKELDKDKNNSLKPQQQKETIGLD